MGAHPDDYKNSAPKNSYIHVDDFDSPEKLAEYLLELDGNDEKYNEYFRWKVRRVCDTQCICLWVTEEKMSSVTL